jgi:predicted DNA-binding antitoxin AbrB/MazE fold protein
MQQQVFEAVFENGVFRPLTYFQFTEGQTVKLIIESESIKTKKCFSPRGLLLN